MISFILTSLMSQWFSPNCNWWQREGLRLRWSSFPKTAKCVHGGDTTGSKQCWLLLHQHQLGNLQMSSSLLCLDLLICKTVSKQGVIVAVFSHYYYLHPLSQRKEGQQVEMVREKVQVYLIDRAKGLAFNLQRSQREKFTNDHLEQWSPNFSASYQAQC